MQPNSPLLTNALPLPLFLPLHCSRICLPSTHKSLFQIQELSEKPRETENLHLIHLKLASLWIDGWIGVQSLLMLLHLLVLDGEVDRLGQVGVVH